MDGKGLIEGGTLTKLFSCSDSAAVEAKKVINNYNRKKEDREVFLVSTLFKKWGSRKGALSIIGLTSGHLFKGGPLLECGQLIKGNTVISTY